MDPPKLETKKCPFHRGLAGLKCPLSRRGRRVPLLLGAAALIASNLHTSVQGLILPAALQLMRKNSPSGVRVLRRPILKREVPPIPPLETVPVLADVPPPPPAKTSPVVVDPFETFVQMRTGSASGPGSSPSGHVYWVGSGTLYEAYSGKELARFEGFDVAKGVRIGPDTVRQLSRKVFWFRDPHTGEVMTEHEGKPVRPIVYDSQVIDYHRGTNGSDDITYTVQNSSRDLHDLPKMKITSSTIGKNMLINVPVFVDINIPNVGRYKAWEFYDYNVDPSFSPDCPPSAVWCRQGSMPPFNTDGNSVMRFTGHRLDSFDELPKSMKEMVETNFPLFRSPPEDECEIGKLKGNDNCSID